MKPKEWLKKNLSSSMYCRLRRAAKAVPSWWWKNDLNRLALLFNTDKWGLHSYTLHYQRYFEPLKNKTINLLEIGVGGDEQSDVGGESLRMWKAYFRKGRIVGIDLHDKTKFRERRIDIRKCDQTDSESLRSLSAEYGGFDIIIDDGSHQSAHVITTFELLFPLLRSNGIYVVEDTQTAYWPSWGGGIDNPRSSTVYFKALTDGLNHVEYPIENYKPNYFDQNIVEIAFFHNMIFIRKGCNDEKTNVPGTVRSETLAASSNRARMA